MVMGFDLGFGFGFGFGFGSRAADPCSEMLPTEWSGVERSGVMRKSGGCEFAADA